MSEIRKNLQELNTYLNKNNLQLSEPEYVEILKTGETPDSLKKTGYEMLDPPRFFEARAMINGNVCMNKVQGIAFPAFKNIPPPMIPQYASEVTVGLSAPIGNEVMTSTELAPGINLIPRITPPQTIPGANTGGNLGNAGNVPPPGGAPAF